MFCKNCGKEIDNKNVKRTFLGFQKIVCLSCSNQVMIPLSKGLKITYWLFVVVFGVSLIRHYLNAIQNGGISISVIIESWLMSIFFFMPIYALIKNKKYKKYDL